MKKVLSLAALAALFAFPVVAQQNCASRDVVVERLANIYGESRQSVGFMSSSSILEIFASSDTGSWTITITSAAGIACVVASGQAFETLAEAMPVGEEG